MNDSRLDNSEFALFAQEMADVAPLKAEAKVLIKKHTANIESDYRREAAEYSHGDIKAPLSLVLRKTLKAEDWLSYKRDGIQQGVFRNLRCNYSAYFTKSIRSLSKFR